MDQLGLLSKSTVNSVLIMMTDKHYLMWKPELDKQRKTHYLKYNEIELSKNVWYMVAKWSQYYPHLKYYIDVSGPHKLKHSVDYAESWYKRLNREYSLRGKELQNLMQRASVVKESTKKEAPVYYLIAPSYKGQQKSSLMKNRRKSVISSALKSTESATRVSALVVVRTIGNIVFGTLDTSAKIVNFGFSSLEKVIMESKKDISTLMQERSDRIDIAQEAIVKFVNTIPEKVQFKKDSKHESVPEPEIIEPEAV